MFVGVCIKKLNESTRTPKTSLILRLILGEMEIGITHYEY